MKTFNCRQFKRLMVDVLYDYEELSEQDKNAFHAHLSSCPGCALEYEEMTSALNVMDQRRAPEMGDDYWDSYMVNLQEKISVAAEEEKPRHSEPANQVHYNIIPLHPGKRVWRWALYPVAATILVLIGIAIGRYLYLPTPVPPVTGEQLLSSAGTPGREISPAVREHFDNLRPMLIDYANYSPGENGKGSEGFVMVDKNILQKMALQNYLLKKIAARENNAALKQVLEELELILLEISNTDPAENRIPGSRKETIQRVQDILSENDLLFKMEIYDKNRNTPKTSTRI